MLHRSSFIIIACGITKKNKGKPKSETRSKCKINVKRIKKKRDYLIKIHRLKLT